MPSHFLSLTVFPHIPSFRGNYSFLDLEIQRSQYIRPKVTVNKCAETIQGRKVYEEIRYPLRVKLGFNFCISVCGKLPDQPK